MGQPASFSLTLPPDKFVMAKNALCAKAQGHFPYDEEVNGTVTSGSVADEGVMATFSYDSSTQLLTVTIIHKPCLLSEGFIEGKVREWFGE